MKAQLEPLSKLVGLPRNPKLHNLGEIHQSIDRFGFVTRIVINDVTNHIIAGHGRVDTLRQKKLEAQSPPEGIEVRDNEWYVPTDRINVPQEEEEALAIALNKIGENEWDEVKTSMILTELASKEQLEGTGFDEDEVDYLLKRILPKEDLGYVSDEILEKYKEEKEHWRWLRLNITDEVYDKWHETIKRAKMNDDQFVDLLLSLVDDRLLEAL